MLATEWNPNNQEPPTDIDRLALFADLARQYEVATHSLRSTDRNPSLSGEELIHSRMVRAALLRKFFLGRHDQVHLDKVAASLKAAIRTASSLDDSPIEKCDTLQADFAHLPTSGGTISNGATQEEYTAWQVFNLVSYGNILHGDYGKWRLTRSYGSHAFMVSLSHTVHRLERLLFTLTVLVREALQTFQAETYT